MILMIAHWNWMDPAIANLQPVLDSYWLMIHVAVIVGSYGPFALSMIIGGVALFLMLLTNTSKKSKDGFEHQRIDHYQRVVLDSWTHHAYHRKLFRRYVGQRELGTLLGLGSQRNVGA